MSCNGCRVLRKGCSESCILRPCLQWIENPEAQGHATVFVAKFFGRAGLMSFISAVPQNQRPALFQSLLYEAAGRTVNPVNGAVGLLWTANWHICQSAVETVLKGGTLRPIPELLAEGTQPQLHEMSENSASEDACNNNDKKFLPRLTNSRSNKFSSACSAPSKRKRVDGEASAMMMRAHAGDLDLRLTPNFPARSTVKRNQVRRPGTPSMTSEESETTTCFESGVVGDLHQYYEEPKLLNLFM